MLRVRKYYWFLTMGNWGKTRWNALLKNGLLKEKKIFVLSEWGLDLKSLIHEVNDQNYGMNIAPPPQKKKNKEFTYIYMFELFGKKSLLLWMLDISFAVCSNNTRTDWPTLWRNLKWQKKVGEKKDTKQNKQKNKTHLHTRKKAVQ